MLLMLFVVIDPNAAVLVFVAVIAVFVPLSIAVCAYGVIGNAVYSTDAVDVVVVFYVSDTVAVVIVGDAEKKGK